MKLLLARQWKWYFHTTWQLWSQNVDVQLKMWITCLTFDKISRQKKCCDLQFGVTYVCRWAFLLLNCANEHDNECMCYPYVVMLEMEHFGWKFSSMQKVYILFGWILILISVISAKRCWWRKKIHSLFPYSYFYLIYKMKIWPLCSYILSLKSKKSKCTSGWACTKYMWFTHKICIGNLKTTHKH